MSYKNLSNYDIAMDIYQKIMFAKTKHEASTGSLHYDADQNHIDIAEIVEHLYFIKHSDKTTIKKPLRKVEF